MELAFILAGLLILVACIILADKLRPKKRFCIWVDVAGNVRCAAHGGLEEINNYEKDVYQYLFDRAQFSDTVNGRILNGYWKDKMPEDGVIGLTEDGE